MARISIKVELMPDGRWRATVPDVPGIVVYGKTRVEAELNAQIMLVKAQVELEKPKKP